MTGQKMVLSPCCDSYASEADFFTQLTSVGDPVPYVSGPPGSGSQRYESGYSLIKKNSEKNLDSYSFVTSL